MADGKTWKYISDIFRGNPKDSFERSADRGNDKFDYFAKVSNDREHKTADLAVSIAKQNQGYGSNPYAAMMTDNGYSQFVYGQMDTNKEQRIKEYRRLASNPKVSSCVSEYKQSAVNRQKDEQLLTFEIGGDYENDLKEEVKKEFNKFINIFNLKEKGRDYINDLLIEGELVWENVIAKTAPERGILDVKRVPAENVEPWYCSIQNEEIDHFLLKKKTRKPGTEHLAGNLDTHQFIPIHKFQMTYAHSGIWSDEKKFRVPLIAKAKESATQLGLIKDAIIINALHNAADHMVVTVDTGGAPDPIARQNMRQVITEFSKKKGIGADGKITTDYNPASLSDTIFLQKGVGSNGGTTVERLAGSQAFGNNFSKMLEYYDKQVYLDLMVPVNRMNPDAQASDGTVATFQELAFAERVKDIQMLLSSAILRTFITHLKLRGVKLNKKPVYEHLITENANLENKTVSAELILETHLQLVVDEAYKNSGDEYTSLWDQWDLDENDLELDFSLPSITLALKEQQYFEIKLNNFNQFVSNEMFSQYMAAKKFLKMTDAEIRANREWKRIEAEEFYETSQIQENGPDYREKLKAELEGLGSEGGGGGIGDTDSALPDVGGGDAAGIGGGAPGGSQGGSDLPEFGGNVDTPEELEVTDEPVTDTTGPELKLDPSAIDDEI